MVQDLSPPPMYHKEPAGYSQTLLSFYHSLRTTCKNVHLSVSAYVNVRDLCLVAIMSWRWNTARRKKWMGKLREDERFLRGSSDRLWGPTKAVPDTQNSLWAVAEDEWLSTACVWGFIHVTGR